MSIKSQEGHMRQLALLLTTDLGCIFDERESGPNGSKKAFLNVGKVFLRALAKDLGLHEVTVSANSGGIAVSGTCTAFERSDATCLFIHSANKIKWPLPLRVA